MVSSFAADRRLVSRDDRRLTARAMAPLLEYLRGLGVVPPVPAVALTARKRLSDAFVGDLVAERGLTGSTIDNYRGVAVRFLASESDRPDGFSGVGAEQVSTTSASRSPASG